MARCLGSKLARRTRKALSKTISLLSCTSCRKPATTDEQDVNNEPGTPEEAWVQYSVSKEYTMTLRTPAKAPASQQAPGPAAQEYPQTQPTAEPKPQDKHTPRPQPDTKLQPDSELEYDYVAHWRYYWDEMQAEPDLELGVLRQVLDLVCPGNAHALHIHRALTGRRVRMAALRLLTSG